MKVQIFPKRYNNMYLIIDEASQEAAFVNPVDLDTVVTAVEENNVSLTKVLYTCFGCCHSNVYPRLCEKFKDLQVYSGDDGIGSKVKHNDTFNIGELQVRCFATPVFNSKDVYYYITGDQDKPAIFTGYTLFVGGCSMFGQATGEHMYTAFIEILGSLPNETKVYCLEDVFTEERLKFAQYVEPENQIIRYKLEWVRKQAEMENPIVPSTIQIEKLTNPFMRVHEQSLMDHTGQKDPIRTMEYLIHEYLQVCFQALKDGFFKLQLLSEAIN